MPRPVAPPPPPPLPPPPPAGPGSFCATGLPASFLGLCGSCHSTQGPANPRYPDLYATTISTAAFRARVRGGGNGMPPFSEALITDAEVDALYRYFAGASRPAMAATATGGVTPLYGSADAVNAPIVFMRSDGVLVTRGAGRVRGRHEGPQDTNTEFMQFLPNYFLGRSFGFVIEDFTPKGESRLRVTYLPLGAPTAATNLRGWKEYDRGDVFKQNGDLTSDVPLPALDRDGRDIGAAYQTLVAPYARVQQGETVRNERELRPIRTGDLFDFEFGIFFDAAGIKPAGSRTAYYTDTFRYRVGQGGLTANSPDGYGGAGLLGPAEAAQQGGGTTNVWPYHLQETYFEQMALNIQHENVQSFLEGRRLFHTSFVDGEHSEPGNPPFPEQAGKAGPLLNATTCQTCHVRNGPGALLEGPLNEESSMVIKLYGAGALGNQLQLQEGTASVTGFDDKVVALADGTAVALRRPRIEVVPRSGTAPRFSARIARKVIGTGLLEAIDESTLMARADPGDCDGNGISGRPSYVVDPATSVWRAGRFGWKAEKVSVEHQVADALSSDMGVGTTLFPEDGKAELAASDLAKLTTYMRLVSVPGQRDNTDPEVVRGEQIFRVVGCASCHVPDAVTGANHPFAELRNQAIKPYSDLLLHDLGPDLADDSGVAPSTKPEAPPAASEWRTPPLWGLGLLAVVNGHTGLLHDGRAASPLEAVLWHGGEAEAVKQRVIQLPAPDRNALLRFLASL